MGGLGGLEGRDRAPHADARLWLGNVILSLIFGVLVSNAAFEALYIVTLLPYQVFLFVFEHFLDALLN